MNVDELIRAADPARGVAIPPGAGLRMVSEPHRPHRALWAVAAGTVAAALVAGVLVVTLPGPTGPKSAAAAVLDQAAAAAGQQAPLGPGQYRYTETQTQIRLGLYRYSATGSSQTATAEVGQTDQAWTDGAGTNHRVLTAGTRQYPSPTDEALWTADPTVLGPTVLRTALGAGGQAQTVPPLVDASSLPTDPTRLAAVIAAQRLVVNPQSGDILQGDEARDAEQFLLDNGQPYSVFEGAAALLIGPTAGLTPALASALFQVMASQPGVQLLGTVTTHDGQSGQGIALPSADNGQVSEIVVDPSSGQILEAQFVLPPVATPAQKTCTGAAGTTATTCVQPAGVAVSFAPAWTDVVARAVVGSTTDTVPATGTATPTAAVVPGAPTGVTLTVLPASPSLLGGGVRLSWQAPADTGSGPVTDYVVEQHAGQDMSSQDTRSTATTYTWPFADGSGTFTVQAVNADGYGPASTAATPTT